ncbi:hypothetical protein V6N00_11520 [Tersicoccus sp. MR15.9]|uniref:hypothetical protein n=1 Tax=Tersicoccus mangrovi TaxID=3121635 RepID=UPI002FE59626
MSVPPSRDHPPDPSRVPAGRSDPGNPQPGSPDPTAAARFRRLCRSSPWRWRTLRFRLALRAGQEPVEVLVRRPLALRIVAPGGTLVFASTAARPGTGSYATTARRSSWLMAPHLVTPGRDSDGLVRRRPEAAYGEPWYDDPRLASALDPAQLAGNAPAAAELPHAEPVTIHALRDTAHEGRPALEAVVSPGHAYRVAEAAAALLGPGRSTVRIDVATGVCVLVEPEDDDAGPRLWLRILDTDEYAGDDEFVGGTP